MVTTDLRTPVLVVGAGVAGSVLALELAHHGVPSMVVERASRPPRHPELNLVTGRGMELLRRLGLAARIRSAGGDQDRATAVAWSRSFGEPPLLITPVPSSNEMRRRYANSTDGSQPVEPYLMLTGTGLATGLRDAVRAHPLIDLREGWTFTDLRLEPDGTVATVLDGGARTRHTVEADYLAGCDGAQSTVRRCLGVPLEEAAAPAHHCTVYFRSTGLGVGAAQPSTIIAGGITLTRRAGSDLWIGHLPLEPEDAPVTDPVALLRRRLGLVVEASQIIGITQWHDALGIARTYRRGTSYLVGQSAHRFHPPSDTVDTCLGDAVDLGWKLAAAVHRWGGPELLSSYEGERRQRAVRDRERLSRALADRRRIGDLAAQGASGDDLADALRDAPPQIDPAGTAVGTEYTSSPVVWRDHRRPTATGPGRRLPAVRLAGGGQLFDLLGPQFTLVDLTERQDGRSLVDSARARGIPMTHLAVADAEVRAGWASELLLVRPDQHIAWRTADRPSDWNRVLDVVTGHRVQEHAIT